MDAKPLVILYDIFIIIVYYHNTYKTNKKPMYVSSKFDVYIKRWHIEL